MTSLILLLLLQTAPATSPPATTPATSPSPPPPQSAPAAPPPPSPEDTLAGLQETYRETCGQTGILYYSYAELCDTLRKQISEYLNKLDREARQPGKTAPPKP
jgi:hypothetical protein